MIALLLVPSALGGLPYLFCIPMDEARLSSCCPPRSADEGERGHPVAEAPCCEGRRVDRLPAAQANAHPELTVPPPVVVGLVPVISWLAELPGEVRAPPRRLPEEGSRAGPEPPLFKLHEAWRC